MLEGAVLERLVALHDERRDEETTGKIRWLRPKYQIPRFAPEEFVEQTTALPEADDKRRPAAEIQDWPSSALDQLAAVKSAVAEDPGDVEGIGSRFRRARRALVRRHLEALRILAEVRRTEDGRYHPAEPLPGHPAPGGAP